MNTTFSFKRIGHILRADLIEHKLYVLFFTVGMLLCWIFLLSGTHGRYEGFFYILLMFLSINYCRYFGGKLHRSKGMFLTLPASSAEKYVAFLTEGLVMLIAYNLFFWVSLSVSTLFSDRIMADSYSLYSISAEAVCTVLFLFAVMLFYYATFRKMPLLLYFVSLAVVMSVVSYTGIKSVMSMTEPTGGNVHIDTDQLLAPFYFLYKYWAVIMLVASAGFFYLSYYKLQRKQLR